MTRGQRGRMYAKVEFVVAGLYVLVAAFLYIAAPQSMGRTHANTLEHWLLLLGVACVVIGFVWMIRIYRTDPEPDQRAWRYRSRR